jgi:hypothetical protein
VLIAGKSISAPWLVAATGITLLLSLLLFVRVPGDGAWLDTALDTSHAPIFAGVVVLVAILLPPGAGRPGPVAWPDWRRCGRALLLSVALGVFVEFLQSFQGRPPALVDVMSDAAGAVAGLALWALVRRHREPDAAPRSAGRQIVVLALLAVAVGIVAWRPVQTARAYLHRATHFPVIVDFGQPIDLVFVKTDGAPIWIETLPPDLARQPGERALAVPYDPVRGGVLRLTEPIPDWRGHGVIAVEVANPAAEDLELDLMIWDWDRYWSRQAPNAQTIRVPPGKRASFRLDLAELQAPADTPALDRSRIEHMLLRVAGPDTHGKLYVARIWLE